VGLDWVLSAGMSGLDWIECFRLGWVVWIGLSFGWLGLSLVWLGWMDWVWFGQFRMTGLVWLNKTSSEMDLNNGFTGLYPNPVFV
jgi:hypothetical protein